MSPVLLVGLAAYGVLVVVVLLFVAGATRRPTPYPTDERDAELDRMLEDEESGS